MPAVLKEGYGMTTVYFVRHAEAEGNLFRRIHGHYDAPLTMRGEEQLNYLRKRFENIKIDAVWSSDLKRAVKTAEAIYAPKGLRLSTDVRLREYCFGVMEDAPMGNALAMDPVQVRYFYERPDLFRVEGAENYYQVEKRLRDAVRRIAEEMPGKTVAVVTHGSALRTLMASLLGFGPERVAEAGHSENTAVSCVEFEGESARVLFRNDHSHLPESLLGRHGRSSRKPAADTVLRFDDMDPDACRELYENWRLDAWKNLYGTVEGCEAEAFWEEAAHTWVSEPRLLQLCMDGDTPAGMLQLSREKRRGVPMGHISFCYLTDEYRGRGLGPQLVGQAVSLFRSSGLHRLQLLVSPFNESAIKMYRRCGFVMNGSRRGYFGLLHVMEREL